MIDGLQIRQVDCVKYLGVWLDQHLSWNEHIRHTSGKIASRLALLRRVRKYLTLDSAKLLANALVLPHFDYCCISWSSCGQGLRDSLVKLHKQMARITLQTKISTSSTKMFSKLKWTSLEKRWQFHKCKLMFDILNGNSPSYLLELFTQSANTHRYSTRSSNNRGLIMPKVKTENGRKAFSFVGTFLWNNLPHKQNTLSAITFSS